VHRTSQNKNAGAMFEEEKEEESAWIPVSRVENVPYKNLILKKFNT